MLGRVRQAPLRRRSRPPPRPIQASRAVVVARRARRESASGARVAVSARARARPRRGSPDGSRARSPVGRRGRSVSPSAMWDSSPRCLLISSGAFACAARTSSASETSCCCAPSCRSRSIRRRVASAVATIRAREGVELGAAVGVRDRRRDDLRELAQAPLRVWGQRLGRSFELDDQHAPEAAFDDDRRAHRRAPARLERWPRLPRPAGPRSRRCGQDGASRRPARKRCLSSGKPPPVTG